MYLSPLRANTAEKPECLGDKKISSLQVIKPEGLRKRCDALRRVIALSGQFPLGVAR